MRFFLLIIGVFLIIAALVSLLQYVFDYNILSTYGKGFIWGKVLLLLVGILLTYFSTKKKKSAL